MKFQLIAFITLAFVVQVYAQESVPAKQAENAKSPVAEKQAEKTPKANPAPVARKTENAKANEKAPADAKKQSTEDRIAELLKSGNDPFAYGNVRAGSGGNELIPVDVANVSVNVRLKGVFKSARSKEAYALVHVGGEKDATSQLVKKNDLILMKQPAQRGRSAQSHAGTKYFLVVEISDGNIIIAPKMRPDEHITIR